MGYWTVVLCRSLSSAYPFHLPSYAKKIGSSLVVAELVDDFPCQCGVRPTPLFLTVVFRAKMSECSTRRFSRVFFCVSDKCSICKSSISNTFTPRSAFLVVPIQPITFLRMGLHLPPSQVHLLVPLVLRLNPFLAKQCACFDSQL